MEVNKINKKLRISIEDSIQYQLITEIIFLKKENLIASDLKLLTLLVLWGPLELVVFCNKAAKNIYVDMLPEEISVRSQNIRNRVVKLEKRGLIERVNKKQIQFPSVFNIVSKGNILLDYNFLSLESN